MCIKTKIFFIFFLILSFVFSVKETNAVTYFSDNFDQNNLDNWIFVAGSSGQESWKIVDQQIVGEVTYGGSSFLLAKSFWNLSNYSIRFDSLNKSGVDQDIVFRVSEDRNKFYLLNLRFKDPLWPQDGGEIVLWKYDSNVGYKRLSTFNSLSQIKLTQNEVHKIIIEANNSNIEVYFDSILIININDETDPILNGSFGFYNWGGNYYQRSTKNLFDNLIIGDFIYDDIETPIVKPKIIILPGLGASWNTDAIVYNKEVNADQWKMTPFVKNYDGLISALKENGLEEDVDFYIWNYDWRRPVSEIVTNLDNFIDEKVGNDEKVILIGHSLGGLVSRIWAEDNKNDSRLENVVNLGSPNLGSIDAYEVWNGGQVSDLSKVSSIAFKILLKIQGLATKTDMEAVRKYMPVVKDLLPTFNYVNKNGKILSNDKLETNNTFLKNKNINGANYGINLKLFAGSYFKTIDSIELKNNNVFDNVLGIWPDGRINKFLYSTSGDGTVLVRSANYGKSDAIEINSKHGEIVNKTINQVMMEIGLSQVGVVGESQDLSNSLVVFVGSPVDYSVKCDNESPVNDNDGFVVIKNKNYKSCNVNLVGNGDGLIHVVAGNTDNTNWYYWEKNITNGEISNIKINPIDGQIINNKDNVSFLKSIIKEDINSLLVLNKNNKELKAALKSLDKNQPRVLIRNIFDFKKGKNETIISGKIIDNATIWLSFINNCSKNEASKGFKITNSYQDLIDNLIKLNKNKKGFKISENAAISYQKMNEILELNQNKITQKNYFEVCANNFAAFNYGTEVLIKAYDKDYFKKWLLQDSNL
ncbi:MAG: hypothetical protein WCT51_04030 [Candidatus Shapirobacteria bacterium]